MVILVWLKLIRQHTQTVVILVWLGKTTHTNCGHLGVARKDNVVIHVNIMVIIVNVGVCEMYHTRKLGSSTQNVAVAEVENAYQPWSSEMDNTHKQWSSIK